MSQDAVLHLDGEPTTTMDYVNLLTFMEEMTGQVERVDEEAGIVKELYDLIEKYQVPVPPEDLAVYQVSKGGTTNVVLDGRVEGTIVHWYGSIWVC